MTVDETNKALGKWKLELKGNEIFGLKDKTFFLTPKADDNPLFREKVLFKKANRDDNNLMFSATRQFILDLILRENDFNETETNEVRELLKINDLMLFEKIMVDFGITTQDEVQKSKQDLMSTIKKKNIGNL